MVSNVSSNFTNGTDQHQMIWSERRIIVSVFYSLLLLTGLVFNVLIIFVIIKRKLLRRSINYFIFNMALSDILLCCFEIAVRFSFIFTYHVWVFDGIFGIITCKIVYFFSEMSPIVSVLSLVSLTLDRFFAIAHPTKANLRTHKFRTRLVIFCWLIPAVYCSKNFYSYTILLPFHFCGQFWGHENHKAISSTFINFYTIVFIFVPLVLLVFMYVAIGCALRKTLMFSQNFMPTDLQNVRQRQRRRINTLAFLIVVTFALCKGPMYFYIYITHSFVTNWEANRSLSFKSTLFVSYILAYLNATVNPILCILFNQEIKNYIKTMSPCAIKKPFGRRRSLYFGRESSLNTIERNVRSTVIMNSLRSRDNDAVCL